MALRGPRVDEGRGRAFSAGADFDVVSEVAAEGPGVIEAFVDLLSERGDEIGGR